MNEIQLPEPMHGPGPDGKTPFDLRQEALGPVAVTERDMERQNERMDREKALQDARTILRAALDLLELTPKTAAALIPKAHALALTWARGSTE